MFQEPFNSYKPKIDAIRDNVCDRDLRGILNLMEEMSKDIVKLKGEVTSLKENQGE